LDEVSAALGVLSRLVGKDSTRFSLRIAPSCDAHDSFEVSARRGEVEVLGTSVSALCRGTYHYLKQACRVQVSWSDGELELPVRLPDFDRQTVTCPYRLRYYLSVCTFGYSAPWWDWTRWEREIDWMAVHGINMPLALGGQELIWQRVFRQLGVS
jgi:alpha-N-acetylglucosaminidase